MTDNKTGYQKGLWAELRAATYLRLKGYRILEMRYKTRFGEVDIICQKGQTVVFVEVKLRKTQEDAAYAINAKNQQRVRQAAELYLQSHPAYNGYDLRFDALVMGRGMPFAHLENAF